MYMTSFLVKTRILPSFFVFLCFFFFSSLATWLEWSLVTQEIAVQSRVGTWSLSPKILLDLDLDKYVAGPFSI